MFSKKRGSIKYLIISNQLKSNDRFDFLSRAAKVYAGARNPVMIDLPSVIPLQIDVTDEKSIAKAAEIASDVSLLINNAGSLTGASLLDGEMDKIRLAMDTHYFGTLGVIRAFA
ncbi:hypothetical protein ACFVRR_23040 [Gottfriedia sp. NPDC057948]|uniref:hypothetical protein n=1 Tax=Gottfriedia sp. NPDC057948 TaxID=3346287 RepID=UPI0036D7AAC6